MMKRYFFIVSLIVTNLSLSAGQLVIISDNNNSLSFQKEKYYVVKIFNEKKLKSMNFEEVTILGKSKTKTYKVVNKVPRKKRRIVLSVLNKPNYNLGLK